MNIYNKIKSLIKTGVSVSTDDTGLIQKTVSKWLGKTQKVMSFTPYGTFGNPPENTQQIILLMRGNESNAVALNNAQRVIKETKQGEYGIGNQLTGSYIYLKENGDIDIQIPNGGNVNINGTEIIMNSGTKGVARLDDTTFIQPTSVQIQALAVDLLATGGFVPSGSPPAPPGSVTSSFNGVIDSSSTTVKAGD